MDDDLSFGLWVKTRRVALRLTQAELAERTGYSTVTIRKIESGDLRPSQQITKRLAEELAVASEERSAFTRLARGEAGAVADDPSRSKRTLTAPYPLISLPSILSEQPSAADPAAVFVGHARELAELAATFETATGGKGQIVFVIGDAGRGKTALVQEFARLAQQAEPALLVASGHCNAHTGTGDPYLPFREVLATLVSDGEVKPASGSRSTESARRLWEALPITLPALVEHAPELIGPFVPAKVLQGHAAHFAPPQATWVQQLAKRTEDEQRLHLEEKRLFVQYTAVLKAIAAQQPLVLILEDLHWIDAASSSLLFHLSREITDSPILILGTYRPDELVGQRSERHPLLSITTELKRQHGDIWLDLSDLSAIEGRHFVDAYLDTQPNRLGEAFRTAFFRHTEGHALFTVELLREMQERGDLRKDAEGTWIEGDSINWRTLPPKVEGVIERRIERLEEGVQEMLAIASVEGEVFTAEVVARIQPWDERALVHRLSNELDRQHRLVTAEALNQVGRQRLSRYRFRHYLFQHYLYQRMDITERAYLHEAVGNVLESLYGEQTELAAVQLAYHFEQAGVTEKAMTYLVQAGEQANRLSANEEAIRYYQQALELSRNEEVYHSILARRGKVLLELFRGKEAVDDYARLLARAQQAGNREQELEFLLGLARAYYLVSVDDQAIGAVLTTRKLYDMAQTLSREVGDKRNRIFSLLPPPWLRYNWPDYGEQLAAQAHEALVLSRELNDEELILESKLAVLMSSGAQEIAELEGALLEEFQTRRDLVRLNHLYYILMVTHYSLGNFARGTLFCDAGIENAAKIGVPPVMYATRKALCLLSLGRYGHAWEAQQQEISDDAHPFSQTFKELGVGIYLFELRAYNRAASIFEQVVVQAELFQRDWLRNWAQLMVAHSLVRGRQVDQPEWLKVAQALANPDLNGLMLFEPMALAPLALEIRAEMTLVEGNLGVALQQAIAAGELATAIGYKPQLVTALELQGSVLLQLGRPAEAISILDRTLDIATKIDYLPLIWRISATRAQALEELGEGGAAAEAWHAAAAVIQQLAATIQQRELEQGFLSDPLIASILARVQQQNQRERER